MTGCVGAGDLRLMRPLPLALPSRGGAAAEELPAAWTAAGETAPSEAEGGTADEGLECSAWDGCVGAVESASSMRRLVLRADDDATASVSSSSNTCLRAVGGGLGVEEGGVTAGGPLGVEDGGVGDEGFLGVSDELADGRGVRAAEGCVAAVGSC